MHLNVQVHISGDQFSDEYLSCAFSKKQLLFDHNLSSQRLLKRYVLYGGRVGTSLCRLQLRRRESDKAITRDEKAIALDQKAI